MSVCNTCALEKECMLKYDVSARMFCNSYAEKKIFTNADRIRAMTDEELAEFINDVWNRLLFGRDLPGMCDVCHTDTIQNCKRCWFDWLKQEVDNG